METGALGYTEAMLIAYNNKCKSRLAMRRLYSSGSDEEIDEAEEVGDEPAQMTYQQPRRGRTLPIFTLFRHQCAQHIPAGSAEIPAVPGAAGGRGTAGRPSRRLRAARKKGGSGTPASTEFRSIIKRLVC